MCGRVADAAAAEGAAARTALRVPPRGGGAERPGGQLDHERARAGERVVLPAGGGAVVARQLPRGQADAARVGADHPPVDAVGQVHQPHVLVVPDRHRRMQPAHEPPHRARLRLRERAPAREVGVERAPAAGPAAAEVAVEVDAARVLARAAADAVGVDRVDEPQLDAGGRRRAAEAGDHRAPGGLVAVDRADDQHLHRTLPHALGAQRLVIGGVAEQERRGGGSQGEHPRHGSVRDRHGLDRHRRRGDVRRLARVVAGARRRAGHARRPVRARRPPRDLGRRDAPDPLRPRRGRATTPRPPAARARCGGSSRRSRAPTC